VLVKGLLGMHNYSYLWMREDGRLTPEEVADRFCDILLGGLTGVEPR
jgi:TetR/AcrR family transcriptional regulator, cholesterol catabolism regulator